MLNGDLSFRMLDLNLLRVLDAMMSEGSVAGAAARLSITPSAVSHSLGRLRAMFDDPLFVRAPGGMRATPRAAVLGNKVRDGLKALEGALRPAAFVARESNDTFTVACSAYVSAVLLPEVIAQLRLRAPRAKLDVVSWNPGVLDRFEAGRVDVLVGDFARVPEGYQRRTLFTDRLVWLMGRDYVLEAGSADRRQALESFRPELADSIQLDSGFARRATLDGCCTIAAEPLGETPGGAVLQSLPYALIAPLLVQQTEIVALLPERLALLYAQNLHLDIVAPNAAPEIGITAIRHPEYGKRPAVAWFCDLLAEIAAGLGRDQDRAELDLREDSRGRSRTLLPR